MKKLLAALFIVTAIGSGFWGRFSMRSLADENRQSDTRRYYKSIIIERGESLWSIARRFNTDGTITTEEYVQELKNMNCLKEDTIHTGQYLTVVYFTQTQLDSGLE